MKIIEYDAAASTLVKRALGALGIKTSYNALTTEKRITVGSNTSDLSGDTIPVLYADLEKRVSYKIKKETKRFNMPMSRFKDALIACCHDNAFHPMQDYLNNLPAHEGELPTCPLTECFELEVGEGQTDALVRQYATELWWSILIAVVQRGTQAGYQYDYLPLLVGKQGVGKSLLCQCLAPRPELFASVDMSMSRQELVTVLRGKVVAEAEELNITKKESGAIKSFITSPVNRQRRKYDRDATDLPRTDIIIGTTNDRQSLPWDTENRRIVPLLMAGVKDKYSDGKLKAYLEGMRDRYYAAAKYLVAQGRSWRLSDAVSGVWQDSYRTTRWVDTFKHKRMYDAVVSVASVKVLEKADAKEIRRTPRGLRYFFANDVRLKLNDAPHEFDHKELQKVAPMLGFSYRSIRVRVSDKKTMQTSAWVEDCANAFLDAYNRTAEYEQADGGELTRVGKFVQARSGYTNHKPQTNHKQTTGNLQ